MFESIRKAIVQTAVKLGDKIPSRYSWGPGAKSVLTLHRRNSRKYDHIPYCGGKQEIARRKAKS